jgi:indolepyruvate ferredoxin oxidoreductase alpha subunit
VSHAAVLCPSFYRAELITHPGWRERIAKRLADRVISALQRRVKAREVAYVA